MEIQILISLKEPWSALKSTQLLSTNYLQNEKTRASELLSDAIAIWNALYSRYLEFRWSWPLTGMSASSNIKSADISGTLHSPLDVSNEVLE